MSRIIPILIVIMNIGLLETALADVAAPLIGNTLSITDDTGETVVLTFAADGTYTRNGTVGTWEEKDGLICMTAESNATTHCEPLETGHGPGDSWEQTSADGRTVKMSLSEGQ